MEANPHATRGSASGSVDQFAWTGGLLCPSWFTRTSRCFRVGSRLKRSQIRINKVSSSRRRQTQQGCPQWFPMPPLLLVVESCSIRDFDNHATCLVANYETVDTYYRRCSSVNYVGNVSVPLLCISALDDPLCTKEAIPWDECRANKNIVLATTTHGGHLAFFQGLAGMKLWWVEAVEEFFRVLHGSPYMHNPKKRLDTGLHSSLESNIDKAPYVNVLEDGMLAAVGDKGEVINDAEGISDKQPTDEKDVYTEPSIDGGVGEQEMGEKGEVSAPAVKPVRAETTTDLPTKKIQEMVDPVRNSVNQLLRKNSRSIWLLTYIAIVTTCPLLGSAILIAFRRKFKGIIPEAWLHR